MAPEKKAESHAALSVPVPVEGLGRSAASQPKGLTSVEATERLRQIGPNQVEREKAVSPVVLLIGQFKSPVIWLLVGASAIAGALGELVDAIAIAAIVVINALVGFFQEFRAERAVLALRAMTAPRAQVLRDGRASVIPAAEVVPDDVLLLDAGDVVAADAKLIEANALLLNEAALTGESAPVEKGLKAVAADAHLAERHDSVFMGTAVANGTGQAVVVATGMKTELGKIAHLLATAQVDATPLQKRLARVSRILLYLCLGTVAAVAALGLVRGMPLMDVFLSAVSLAVAAVPEGLPAVVTIALAIGVQRMVSRHVLVRRLPAVETLGCATVICTDKTGTLTTGVMRVRDLWSKNHAELIRAACACCDAELDAEERTGTGDPTEVALLLAGVEYEIRRHQIESERSRVATNPFDSERKRMSVRRSDGVLYVKGALEATLPLCITGTEGAREANQQMAERGLRVLAVAVGQGEREENLRLLGLVGIADPPRTEAIEAVAAARAAGIRTVMITGDHPTTARAIARELGIIAAGENPDELVHARATPEDKLTIVRRWKSRGEVVAMTGDGVNDAPALREAHIGVAMGRTGTEVTREAADMILTDDNFASIVAAVREGRGIFDNIRKTLVYLLAGNASELAVMFGAALVGLPLPLLPLHLLWINLVTDGLPALALVTDPVDADAMTKPPRKPDEPMLARAQWKLIGMTGLLEATVTLGVFAWALQARDLTEARNLAFSVLVFGELFRAFAARSPDRIFWEVGAFTNLRLLGVVVVSVFLQLGLHHIPWTQKLFQIGALPLSDCALALGLGLIPVTILELTKLARRLGHRGTPNNVPAGR
jgi:Ca2+-transporting ATPase